MAEERDPRKSEIVKLIKEVSKPRRPRPPHRHVEIQVGGNVERSLVAAGDIHVHHHHPQLKRYPSNPDEREAWHKELSGAIWTRAAELKLTSDQLYELVARKLRKRVTALNQLNERDLGRIYDLVFNLKRPSLGA